MKKIIYGILLSCLIIFSLPEQDIKAGGNDECVVGSTCYFTYIAIDAATHTSYYATAVNLTTDLNIYYAVDGATSATTATEYTAGVCTGMAATDVCLTAVASTRGWYQVAVGSSLLTSNSGKELCIQVIDVNTTRKVDDATLCKYIRTTALTSPGSGATAAQIWQDSTAGDFTVASSIGKSLYTGNVAPGGSGGLLISGSNTGTTTFGGMTVTGALTVSDGVIITASTTNRPGISSTGNGTSTPGVKFIGGSVSGPGLELSGTGTSAALYGYSASGPGGFLLGGTNQPGLRIEGSGNADGFTAVKAGTGVDIRGNITGNVSGSVSSVATGGITAASLTDGAILTEIGGVYGTLSAGSTGTNLISTAFSATQSTAYVGMTVIVNGVGAIVQTFNPATDAITPQTSVGTVTTGDPVYLIPTSLYRILYHAVTK